MDPINPIAKPAKGYLFYLAHIAGCLLLLIPAFYNGFGILNSDFGTYLPSGFKPEMPVDRPITYGILLRIFSLNGLSLWLVLLAQAFFVSNLIIRLLKHIVGGQNYPLLSIFAIAFLSLGTPLSWTVSQFQPDIYTGIALMCVAILLISNETKLTTIFTCVLYFVAIGTHFSHVMIFLGLLFIIAIIFSKTLFKEKKKRVFLLSILTITPIVIMLTPMAKSKHVFLMGSLLEKGVLKKYLDNRCATEQYKLCAYKDTLPAKGDDFIWDGNSPVYKEGGWAAIKPEYNKITGRIFSSPEYLWVFAKSSMNFTARQLYTFDIGSGNIPFEQHSFVYDGIAMYAPLRELSAFEHSRQQRGMLLDKLSLPNKVFPVILVLSMAIIIILLVAKRGRLSKLLIFFIILSFLAILINAWDCGTFSNVNGRYGFRMIWLMPFCAVLLFLKPGAKGMKSKGYSILFDHLSTFSPFFLTLLLP